MPVAALVDYDRVRHLSRLEMRLAATKLGVDLSAIAGPPVGAIVGEAPGPNTSPDLPMFPLPSRSAGGRLLGYARISPADYLGRLARRNLFPELADWSVPAARGRSFELLWWLRNMRPRIRRVLLLGGRVAAAFGVEEFWRPRRLHRDLTLVAIPHPSGRNRLYNDPEICRRAGAEVRWAAGMRRTRP